jgi:hypothetical protein
MHEVEQLKNFLTNTRGARGNPRDDDTQLQVQSFYLRFDILYIYLGASKHKTLHDFYFNEGVSPYPPWNRWRAYFEFLLEVENLPDNIRESINNILIMDSL